MLDDLINTAVVTQSGESYLVPHFAWRPMIITPVIDFLIITAILETRISCCTLLCSLVAHLWQASLIVLNKLSESLAFFLQLISGQRNTATYRI